MPTALPRGDAFLFPINIDPNLLTHAAGSGAGQKRRDHSSPPPHAAPSARSPLPQQPATNQRPVASHPVAHQPLPSQRGKARTAPLPTAARTPACHANSLAQTEPPASRTHGFFKRRCSGNVPPILPKSRSPRLADFGRVHMGPPPSPSLRHSISRWLAAPPGPGGASWGWDVGRGLLAREGASPQPGCSPLAAVGMQGLRSALTQREEQAEASEEQGGLREPSFRAHFEGLLCMERTWCWCGFWWWWFAFFERPGYLQVTYNIRAALFPQPNMAGWSGAGSKKSVNAMVGGFQPGKWEGRKIFP